jgi:beta-glucosidase
MHDLLGDRVMHWTTLNEPLCSSLIAYASGEHAPGLRDPRAALAAVHHQHLAHGLAVEALRDRGTRQLGITLNLTNAVPDQPADPVDIEAARRIDALVNRMYLEPILLSRYPADLLHDVREHGLAELIVDGDMKIIGAPIDFLGVNYYHDDNVSGHPLGAQARPNLTPTSRAKASPFVGSEYVTFPRRDLPRTAMDWEVNPDGLRALLIRLGREYPNLPPLYVTENGGAYSGDSVGEDGRVHDPDRTAYILQHVRAVADAVGEGADVRGYFLWSLLDNFEWAWGFQKRFGIVHVDYATQVRTIKDSGLAYSRLIREGRQASSDAN